jgi:6-pyruvoyltetrahydropterin/6-carboxytetrahydropterin synthase
MTMTPDFEIFKEFTFDAAHRLTRVPEGHQCARQHGHTYHVTVFAAGHLNEFDWVVDYADITEAWNRECKRHLDHRDLNEFFGSGHLGAGETTSENIAQFIYTMMKAAVPQVSRVIVRETATAGCQYPSLRQIVREEMGAR